MGKSEFDTYFALREKGAFREAYDVLQEILTNSPRWSSTGDLYVWCAEFELLLNDDICRAHELLDKASELGCRFEAQYYRHHGYVMWRLGERAKGIEELERCVELKPDIANLKSFGKLLTEEKDARALAVWKYVIDKVPTDSCAHVYMGREMARSGDRARALLFAKRAERLSPSAQDSTEIARFYLELGRFQDAIDNYLKADREGQRPKGPLYAAIAACYFSIGEDATAEEYLRWAIRHDPEHEYVKEIAEQHRMGGEGDRDNGTESR